MRLCKLAWSVVVFFAVSTCSAQMYTIIPLGSIGGGAAYPRAVNYFGQVVGYSDATIEPYTWRAFRTAPNSAINPATDDLGPFPPMNSYAGDINIFGQVVGEVFNGSSVHAFRTTPNKPINLASDDLGGLGGTISYADGINASGQVVGWASLVGDATAHAFRTVPNRPINPKTDDLGTLGGTYSDAYEINSTGQVAGSSAIANDIAVHAYRTASNSPINPATDDLGTLGGSMSRAWAINMFGQVIGWSTVSGDMAVHAFRTAPNSPIDPTTDDLGTLGGDNSQALAIDSYGQVVGSASNRGAFLFSNGVMHDLNNLIPAGSSWRIGTATGINDAGEIAAQGGLTDSAGTHCCRAMLLVPIYRAFVRHPINADGSSIFSAKRSVIPVKFTLSQSGAQTCNLLAATIALTRAASGTLTPVDQSTYASSADNGANFRVNGCQYIYNLAASSLGVGTYRADISINGIMVGHAVFALR